MGNIIQHLRGSVVDHSTYTGKKGEISLVTDASEARIPTGEIRIHDDSTPGGLPIVLGTTTNPLTSNIVLGSGVGINFHNYGSEDSNSATIVGNNLLDDYEEGSWTPILTNVTLGNAIIGQNKYVKIGTLVYLSVNITFGDETSFSPGDIRISLSSLPFTPSANGHGSVYLLDYGTAAYLLPAAIPTSTSLDIIMASTTTAQGEDITNTAPFTWAVNDRINLALTYITS